MSILFDSEFLKKIQQLTLASKIVLSEGAGGNRKSKSKGSSVEFSDYREYSEGDDFRRVDWNAYGRFEKLFIKLFMEEREAPVCIFLDISKSMDWGEPNKSVASRRLAAALSYISLSNYDRVSLFCIHERLEKAKLSLRGKNAFGEVMDFYENIEYGGNTDLLAAVSDSHMKSARGISIVISDLMPSTRLSDAIKFLQYRKQEVHICHLLSPQEIHPEINTSFRLIDSETEEFRDVTSSPLLLKTYRKIYGSYISEIEELCFKRGADYIRIDSSLPVEQMIKKVVSGE